MSTPDYTIPRRFEARNRRPMERRYLAVATALLATILFVSAANAESYTLRTAAKAGDMQRIQAVLEVKGELRLNPAGTGVTKLPLEVSGKVLYKERLLEYAAEWNKRRSVRLYEIADAKIKIGNGVVQQDLSKNNRLLTVQGIGNRTAFAGMHGPLTRDELELVDIQANSLLLDTLLPSGPVEIGDEWKVADGPLAAFFAWDVVTQNQLKVSLKTVNDGIAVLEVDGKVHGAVEGVASDVEMKAKVNFNLQTRQINWLAANIGEQRAIGHAEPGFDVTARLRLATVPLKESAELSDSALASLPLGQDISKAPLRFDAAESHFRILHDRRWHVMSDRHDLCVLRYIDGGDLIAQCNVSILPDFDVGKYLSLEEFQAEVRRSLGENFQQFIEATKAQHDEGRRVLRVVASGVSSEIPIQWVYYHISDANGRRAALAFSLETDLVAQFAEADREIADSFEFTKRPVPESAETPTPRTAERSSGAQTVE